MDRSSTIYTTPCLKKTAKLFLSQVCQMSTKFDNFWHTAYKFLSKSVKYCRSYDTKMSVCFYQTANSSLLLRYRRLARQPLVVSSINDKLDEQLYSMKEKGYSHKTINDAAYDLFQWPTFSHLPKSHTVTELRFSMAHSVWLGCVVVSALGMRTRRPRFESRVAPLFHWVATLGKLFTHSASAVSQLQETGVQNGVFST